MDFRGVTLSMDMDTVIANNTARRAGNVISACVSQITANGLDARLDPVYPLYCSIYDEGNSSNPMSQSITTDTNTTPISPTTEYLTTTDLMSTYTHAMPETESFVETTTDSTTTFNGERTTATQQMEPSMATTIQQSSTSGDIGGDINTHTTNEVSTSSPSSTTPGLSIIDDNTTTSDNSTPLHNPLMTIPTLIAGTQSQINSATDATEKVAVGGQSTTSASISPTTDSDVPDNTNMNYSETSTATESHRKTEAPGPLAKPTHPADIMDLTSSPNTNNNKETDSCATTQLMGVSTEQISTHDSSDGKKTDSSITTLLMSVSGEVQANEEDKYGIWNSSQQALLQVAIISLAILCAVCFTVCAIMIVLFFIACQKRNAPPQGYYRKVPLTEKDQDVKLSETKELGKE